MYVPDYVCVSAAVCAGGGGGGGGGGLRACAYVTFFLSFCHAKSVQPSNSN